MKNWIIYDIALFAFEKFPSLCEANRAACIAMEQSMSENLFWFVEDFIITHLCYLENASAFCNSWILFQNASTFITERFQMCWKTLTSSYVMQYIFNIVNIGTSFFAAFFKVDDSKNHQHRELFLFWATSPNVIDNSPGV